MNYCVNKMEILILGMSVSTIYDLFAQKKNYFDRTLSSNLIELDYCAINIYSIFIIFQIFLMMEKSLLFV
jgi:hypothetical protein